MKSWLEKHVVEMYLTHNEGKSVKFINTWLQYQKSVNIDKLDDIVNKYKNIYHLNYIY